MRRDGVRPGKEDDLLVESVVREELAALELTDRRGEPAECRVGRHSEKDTEGIFVTVTRYWLEEEEDGLDPNVVLAREEPLIKELAARVEARLARSYRVDPVCSHW